MNEANHNFHQDYSKPIDQCGECIDEELARIAREEEIERQVDEYIEMEHHQHEGSIR